MKLAGLLYSMIVTKARENVILERWSRKIKLQKNEEKKEENKRKMRKIKN